MFERCFLVLGTKLIYYQEEKALCRDRRKKLPICKYFWNTFANQVMDSPFQDKSLLPKTNKLSKQKTLPCRTAEACKKPQIPALLNLLNLLLSGIHADKEDD